MTLGAGISAIDPGRVALIEGQEETRFGQLAELAAGNSQLDGARVFVNLAGLGTAIRALVALDGRADRIALTSPWQDREVVRALATVEPFDAILCDTPDTFAGTGAGAGVVSGLHDVRSLGSASGATGWLLTTSGTTGAPKMVCHGFSSLTRSTRKGGETGVGQVWGMVYDYSRFAGLQVVLQSLLSGATLVVPPFAQSLEEKLAAFSRHGCTHLSATPTLWRKILMTPASRDLRLKQITLGGEIADDTILSNLTRAFPEARISHIFASTEAGVGFSVRDGLSGFPASYLDEPPQGIGLRIVGGILHVRNDEVAPTYVGSDRPLAEDGWVNTGDRVDLRDGRVHFLGRESGVINVGGDKVFPEEVERAILAHPDVRGVRVFAKRNPIMGALVAAEIEANEVTDAKRFRTELAAFLQGSLEKHKIPAMITLVDGLDINVAGKLQRKV